MEPHTCHLQVWVSVQPTKTHVKAPGVNFFGFLYDADGVHLDLEKVNAVHAITVPTNITKLQEFLGLVTYLSPFILGLSTLTCKCPKEGISHGFGFQSILWHSILPQLSWCPSGLMDSHI